MSCVADMAIIWTPGSLKADKWLNSIKIINLSKPLLFLFLLIKNGASVTELVLDALEVSWEGKRTQLTADISYFCCRWWLELFLSAC